MYPNKNETLRDLYLAGKVKKDQLDDIFDDILDRWHDGLEKRSVEQVVGINNEEYAKYISNDGDLDQFFDSGVKTMVSNKY